MSLEEPGPSRGNRSRRRRRPIVEPRAGPSSGAPLTSPIKKRKPTNLSVGEQEMLINIYKYVRNTWPENEVSSNQGMVEKTAQISGLSKSSVYHILAVYRDSHKIQERGIRKKKKNIIDKLDSFEISAIRAKVHQYFLAGELPNLDKILQAVNNDDQLPNLSKTSLRRILRYLKFKYTKRSRNSGLIDRPEIVVWRTKYLDEIQKLRNEGHRIYYLDETWVNAGHTVGKVWEDTTVQSSRQALLEGLSTGAKNPSGKGKRLIVVHIGNEEGFLEGCEWVFESSTTGDYHESMDAPHFEQWFEKVLQKLQSGDVVVMDNASYHSRRLEKTPTMGWRKENIQEWLQSKQIPYETKDKKAHLISKVKLVKHLFQRYVTDEMAKEKGITVVRLPPYHCELNPIELVWANVKGFVARNNKTFKFSDVKRLLSEGLTVVTPEKWKNCVQHVLKVEQKMGGMDDIVDQTADRLIINVTDSSSESSSSSDIDHYLKMRLPWSFLPLLLHGTPFLKWAESH